MPAITRSLWMTIAVVLAAFSAALAHAGTATGITGLYTTGADADGNGRDDHWLRNGSAAYVVSNANAGSNGWVTAGGAQWISTSSTGYTWWAGSYAYSLTFTITGAPGTNAGDIASDVSLYLTLAVESSAIITINGGNSVSTTGGNPWAQTQNIALNNGFIIGNNTLTITVQNPYWLLGTQGVLVSSIAGVVPEVGAWVPLAGVIGLVIWFRLRAGKRLPLAA